MLFKSVLFFGAGTVIVATGERDMERLGGLIHRMPLSSGAFLAASMAISALPPFNGFASEWLIFQSILVSPQLPQMGLKLLVPAIGVLLALAAALAAACFVRAFGTTYLGRARTTAAAPRRRSRSLVAGGDARLRRPLPVGRRVSRDRHRLAAAGRGRARGRAHAAAGEHSLAVHRAGIGKPQFLQWPAAVRFRGRPPPGLAAVAVHRFASRTVRHAPFWDCGYPGPRRRRAVFRHQPVTAHTAGVRNGRIRGA